MNIIELNNLEPFHSPVQSNSNHPLLICRTIPKNSTIDSYINHERNSVSDELWKYFQSLRHNGLVIYEGRLFIPQRVLDLGDSYATAKQLSDTIKDIAKGHRDEDGDLLKYHLEGSKEFFYINSLEIEQLLSLVDS